MGNSTRFLILLTATTTPSPPPSVLYHRLTHLIPHSLPSLHLHRRLHNLSHSLSPLPLLKLSHLHTQAASSFPPPPLPSPHYWPEWSHLLHTLSSSGLFNAPSSNIADYVEASHLPDDFLHAANACLAYASQRPDILGMLSRRDIEVLVQHSSPFLFKNGHESVRRMTSFLGGSTSHVLDTDRAHTVDLMKFLLSYASNLTSSRKINCQKEELVEASVRNLLREFAQLCFNSSESKLSGSVQNQFVDRFVQTRRPPGQNIEMKKGDWICTSCKFMNFARNMKCLECNEARPKMQLTGGEWECPQCDFFNYGRNTACLKCDCKRPGNSSLGPMSSGSGLGYASGSYEHNLNTDSRLVANEQKAQRWFSKVSQMGSLSDMDRAIADEDFPEIMPLRKGVNKFVVSTRKTPLERRLASAQPQRSLSDDRSPVGSQTLNGSLEEIIGQKSAVIESDEKSAGSGPNTQMDTPSLVSKSTSQSGASMDYLSNVDEKEQAEKSERWFKRVAELHNVSDLASAVSDDDFPEIMPTRKGENRFVVSKKKDRSLTSPIYKKRLSMEQANNTNYVPFVPFPPNYFAKKENQQPVEAGSPSNPTNHTSGSAALEKSPEKVDDSAFIVGNVTHGQIDEYQQSNAGSWNSRSFEENLSEMTKSSASREVTWRGNSTQKCSDPDSTKMQASVQHFSNVETSNKDTGSRGYSWKENNNEKARLTGTASQSSNNGDTRGSWNGESLEGSAVKEPDPLDMSEEAKAERWFRRVAQIKDISELSQIPDEDFPSIMPMRKGVNRFVVSKRKTPLERRLTSTQHRRNLPIVSSDTVRENDNS